MVYVVVLQVVCDAGGWRYRCKVMFVVVDFRFEGWRLLAHELPSARNRSPETFEGNGFCEGRGTRQSSGSEQPRI